MADNKSDAPSISDDTDQAIGSYKPPSVDVLYALSGPLRNYFKPQFFGWEHVDKEKPALYVANHAVYGITDAPLFMPELYKRKGIYLRVLADNNHFAVAGWRDFMHWLGALPGSRENCARLMEAGAHILVFPGGGRETFKHKGEKHQIIWKQRTGFAYMAIRYKYDIVPVVSVGGDDAYTIFADSTDILQAPIGKLIARLPFFDKLKEGEYLPPVSKGLLGTFLPRPVKIYISFGERISTAAYQGITSDENIWHLRNTTEYVMLKNILHLLGNRKKAQS
ncbi:MAG: hypothetical protein KatS3mg031_0540 [Chitinophagales bacterium]|nr:MAG: hypothetical protein KatS3mg031_0540 [Chitinophagales bacterium]